MVNAADLPRLRITLNGKTITALLDTGANRNYIQSRFATPNTKLNAETVNLAACGQKMKTTGTANIDFRINDKRCNAMFVVSPELRDECILGLPFFQAEEATMDFKRHCIHFGQERRHTTYWTCNPSVKNIVDVGTLQHGFQGRTLRDFGSTVTEYADLFHEPEYAEGTKSSTHQISLTTTTPVASRPYRVSDSKKRAIQDQVDEMLARGIIEPSHSPYASPVVMVPKKDGELRFCVDYRKLNEITVSEPTPMPIITETLRDLGTAKYFSSLDLKSGYWQIPMDAKSKPFTAFTTPDGASYHFRFMPFGLKNAPATFQRLMTQDVLVGYLRHFALVYLDDIIVFSNSLEEHLYHLRLVFERLREHRLYLSSNKCVFGKTSLEYLGHEIHPDITTPQERHLTAIKEHPKPHNRKALRQYLGVCNWVRNYIPRFAETAAPLTDLLSVKKPFKWTAAASQAMNEIRKILSHPVQLHRPDGTLPFTLQTDACGIGLAAVLYQVDPAGERRIISYASARLSPTEQRYHVNEQECLALVWAVKQYRPLLEGRSFTVKTDSTALTWLHRFKDERAKLMRWALLLQEFDMTIEHCPGKDNELADALSRNPSNNTTGNCDDNSRMEPPIQGEAKPVEADACLNTLPDTVEMVLQGQRDDPKTQRLIQRMQDPADQYHDILCQELEYIDGQLWRAATETLPRRLWVPEHMSQRVIYNLHDEAGHPGRDETIRAIETRYHWNKLRAEVRDYVQRCIICAASKRGHPQDAAPIKARVPIRPWQTVAVDLMGPYPRTTSGKTNILVITDTFTKWVEAFAIGNAKTPAILKLLEEQVFHRYGYPEAVITDNGPQFQSFRWKRSLQQWGVNDFYTAIYHPRGNPTERKNQDIKKGLTIRLRGLEHREWAKHLPYVIHDLRNRRNAATGRTPSEALLGYDIPRPGEWRVIHGRGPAPEHADRPQRLEEIKQKQLRYLRRYNQAPAPPRFQEGQEVLVKNHPQSDQRQGRHKGFAPKWLGPYTVRDLIDGRVYIVERGGNRVRVHADQVRPMPPPPELNPPSSPVPVGTDEEEEDDPQLQRVTSNPHFGLQGGEGFVTGEEAKVRRSAYTQEKHQRSAI